MPRRIYYWRTRGTLRGRSMDEDGILGLLMKLDAFGVHW